MNESMIHSYCECVILVIYLISHGEYAVLGSLGMILYIHIHIHLCVYMSIYIPILLLSS